MSTLTNVKSKDDLKNHPEKYHGRQTISKIQFNSYDKESDIKYYDNDEYMIRLEKTKSNKYNHMTIFRKDDMPVESWYDMWNIKNQI